MVKKLRKKRFLIASGFLVLVFFCGVFTPVTLAFSVSGHKWANSSTYYVVTSNYTNQSSGWGNSASTAFSDWNNSGAPFLYYSGNTSEKITVDAGNPGGCGLAATIPSYAAFTGNIVNVSLTVNTVCGFGFFDGTQNGGNLPPNYYDLKSVMRHEDGHAQGICHSSNGSYVMYGAYGEGEIKYVDTDASHASSYIYSGSYTPESGCIN